MTVSHNIKISSQYLKKLSFKSPEAPTIFLEPIGKPDIELSIDLDAKKIGEESFEISLKIKADAGKGKIFSCEIDYAGIFIIGNSSPETLEQILLIYCPNLLFPFARKIIAGVTIDAGFPPLMIEPIDFSFLYQKRKNVTLN